MADVEKTPSVAISFRLAPPASFSLASRSAMSLLRKRNRVALHRRTPSMMLAWLSASLITTSSLSRTVGISPSLAFQQET